MGPYGILGYLYNICIYGKVPPVHGPTGLPEPPASATGDPTPGSQAAPDGVAAVPPPPPSPGLEHLHAPPLSRNPSQGWAYQTCA